MSSNTYGVVYGTDNIYTDVSNTLKGAKRYATLNNFDRVGVRFNSGYHVKILAKKIDNKWVNFFFNKQH